MYPQTVLNGLMDPSQTVLNGLMDPVAMYIHLGLSIDG